MTTMKPEEICSNLERAVELAQIISKEKLSFGDLRVSAYNGLIKSLEGLSVNELVEYHKYLRELDSEGLKEIKERYDEMAPRYQECRRLLRQLRGECQEKLSELSKKVESIDAVLNRV